MSSNSEKKIYVKVGGQWHQAEPGHTLTVVNRPAVKLVCTSALVARVVPESTSKPAREICPRCRAASSSSSVASSKRSAGARLGARRGARRGAPTLDERRRAASPRG